MGVYIKEMRMPENCDVCMFGDWSNYHQTACCKLKDYKPCFSDFSREYRTQRSTICPLIDLGKHGDLIDVDAFRTDYGMKNNRADCEKEMRGKMKVCEYCHIYSKMDFCNWLYDADVVIEAEGE